MSFDLTAIEGYGARDVCILGGSTTVAVMLSTSDSCVDGYTQDIYHACGMGRVLWWLCTV